MSEDLATIRVLFRAPDTLSLYGIPYEMRDEQQPGDLWRSTSNFDHLTLAERCEAMRLGFPRRIVTPGPRHDWIWLGCPGWWGSLNAGEIAAIQRFLEPLMKIVPGGPYEWISIHNPRLP